MVMASDLRKFTGHKKIIIIIINITCDVPFVAVKTASYDTKILDTSENSQFLGTDIE